MNIKILDNFWILAQVEVMILEGLKYDFKICKVFIRLSR